MPDKHVPQDSGTGLPSQSDRDWIDAANAAANAHDPNYVQCVVTGMGFTVDYANNLLDVGAGQARLLAQNVSTVDHGSGTISWPEITQTVYLEGRTGLALTDNDVNHVYLSANQGSPDDVSITINTTGTAPSAPSLKLGEVDTGADTATEQNREPDATFGDTTHQSVITDDLGLTDHLIYIFQPSSAGDMLVSIDPRNHTNPVQEAWDQAPDGSVIRYPPATLDVPSTLSGAGRKLHVGAGGWAGTTFQDTDESTPFYQADVSSDESHVYFSNIRFISQSGSRSAAGFVFNANIERWNIGADCRFLQWGGHDLFHFNTGHPYSSQWESPAASGYNRFIHADSLGAPLTIESPDLGSSDGASPEFDIDDSGHINITDGWNKGGTACQLFTGGGSGFTHTIGSGNWEPSTSATIDNIVNIGGSGEARVGTIRVNGSYTINNAHVQFESLGGGTKHVDGARNTVYLNGDVIVDAGVIYAGLASNVDNQSGGTLTNYVTCVGDMVKKASTGTGYDGGTADSKLADP